MPLSSLFGGDPNSVNWGDNLEWEGASGFSPPSEFDNSRGSYADAGKGAEYKFAPNQQNLDLLRSLGYTGEGFTAAPTSEETAGAYMPMWSDQARNWLSGNGYSLGVGHIPGTDPGGRPEYFGLLGPDNKYVQGQSTPTATNSDTLMDQIAMFSTFLGPMLGMVGAAGAAAGGASAGLGEAGAAAGGSLGAGAGSGAAAGLGGAGAGAAGAAGGLGSLAADSGSVGSGLSGSAGAGGGATTSVLPPVSVTGTSTGSGLGGLYGAGAGTAGGTALANSGGTSIQTNSPISSSADKGQLLNNNGYGQGMTGNQTSVYDNVLDATGSKGAADAATNGISNPMIRNALINGLKSKASGGSFTRGAAMGAATSGLGGMFADMGYGSQGLNTSLLGGLASIYASRQANNAINSQLDNINGLYGPDSAYAKQMEESLRRRDAAAGRRSQYGPRAVELQAALAGQAGKLAPMISQLNNQKTGNRNLLLATLMNNPSIMGGLNNGFSKLGDMWNNYYNSPSSTDWMGGDNSGFEFTGGGG